MVTSVEFGKLAGQRVGDDNGMYLCSELPSSFFTWRVELIPASKSPTVVVFVVFIHLLAPKPSPCIEEVAAARFVTNPSGTAVPRASQEVLMLSETPLLIGVAILLLVGVALVVGADTINIVRCMRLVVRSNMRLTSSGLRTVGSFRGVLRKG